MPASGAPANRGERRTCIKGNGISSLDARSIVAGAKNYPQIQ